GGRRAGVMSAPDWPEVSCLVPCQAATGCPRPASSMPSGRLPSSGSPLAMAAELPVEVATGSAGIAPALPLLEEVVLPAGGGVFPKVLGCMSPTKGSGFCVPAALQPLSRAKVNRAPDQHARARAPRACGVFPLSCALCIL